MTDRVMTLMFSIVFAVAALIFAGLSMQNGKGWTAAGFGTAALVLISVALLAYLHPQKD